MKLFITTFLVSLSLWAKPNIIIILADDIGYGDLAINGGKIATPHLDQMAKSGISFTDAHSSSSVCTPSRYSLLTGRYCWRTSLKRGVINSTTPNLIKDSRVTLAKFLQVQNYNTALIGKWHLGVDWTLLPNNKTLKPKANLVNHPLAKAGIGRGWNVDYSQAFKGPLSYGFDYYWGVISSLDMPPYVYLENDKALEVPTVVNSFNRRPGPATKDFDANQTLIHTAHKAEAFLSKQTLETPFFLLLSLTSPHTPISPSKKWQGQSEIGEYGDFVMETDWVVGRIYKKLKELNLDKNTIVFFTADNGCSPDADIQEMKNKGHYPNGQWRGAKTDIYEGGHRVPLLVTWPNKVKTQSSSKQLVCGTDFFATIADILNLKHSIKDDQAEDSLSFLPTLLHSQKSPRKNIINHSGQGVFAIRNGDWKLILSSGSGGRSEGKEKSPYQVYNLKSDPSEQNNLWSQNPEKVRDLVKLLSQQIQTGRSTNGSQQRNDGTPPFPTQISVLFPELIQ